MVGATLAFTSVEEVTGSASADALRGDAGANVLIGGLGDDVLVGRGSTDTLIGGTPGVVSTDLDTVDYSSDSGPVVVNLATGTATDGSGATDALVAIERAVGSAFADTLIGDAGNNMLTGLGGDDTLTGGAGADTFVATANTSGVAAFGNDIVTDFNVAQDVVNLRALQNIRSFADVQPLLSQVGAARWSASMPSNSVRLMNVSVASLTANNFAVLSHTIVGTSRRRDAHRRYRRRQHPGPRRQRHAERPGRQRHARRRLGYRYRQRRSGRRPAARERRQRRS